MNYGRGALEEKKSRTGISQLHCFGLILFCPFFVKAETFQDKELGWFFFLICLLDAYYEVLCPAVSSASSLCSLPGALVNIATVQGQLLLAVGLPAATSGIALYGGFSPLQAAVAFR